MYESSCSIRETSEIDGASGWMKNVVPRKSLDCYFFLFIAIFFVEEYYPLTFHSSDLHFRYQHPELRSNFVESSTFSFVEKQKSNIFD
jgi:hypothetical protein